MATTNPQSPNPSHPYWQVPSLSSDDRVLGGVAAGIAREVGIDPTLVRFGFVVLFATGGWGVLFYLVAWGGFAQLGFLGRHPTHPPVPKGLTPRRRQVAVVLIIVGLAILLNHLPGLPPSIAWPVGMLAAGALITWRQTGVRSAGEPWSVFQVAIGLLIGAIGFFLVLDTTLGINLTDISHLAAVGATLGLLAVSAPWWIRMVQQLDAERQARVRSDERAEVAAHIHDSVLQTLTLIQQQDNDAAGMRSLARRQERELRNWLDPNRADREGLSVRGWLDDIATSVEARHGVNVEVVVVGDCLVTGAIEAALGATREAVVNAAKHSGAERVDVYVEVRPDEVDIFVRDTGRGFVPDAIAADRRGITESIEGRMARAGGTATISTEIGGGTEVEIRVPRPGPGDTTNGREGSHR